MRAYEDNLAVVIEHLGDDDRTDSDQLDGVGRRAFGRRWAGVFAADLAPVLRPQECAIVNTDDASGPGVHWVAMAADAHDTYLYDSFGRDYRRLSRHWRAKKWKRTDPAPEQAVDSELCGQRCLAWLLTTLSFPTSEVAAAI